MLMVVAFLTLSGLIRGHAGRPAQFVGALVWHARSV
jgi:hypothetical protein